MNPDYYNEYYRNEREHWWFRAREKILEAQVSILLSGKDKSTTRILNVGAATGRTSEWLSKFGKVSSLEYDLDCCVMTRQMTGLEITHGSVLELPYDVKQFDLVVAFDVIEHIEQADLAISEMSRVSKTNGHLFVTVPAYQWLWSEHDDINHHIKRYTMSDLDKLFERYPLVYSSYFNSLLFPFIAAFRWLKNRFAYTKNSQARSDFSRSKFTLISSILEKIFAAESIWLRHYVKLPCGVSLIYIVRNQSI